MPITNHNNIALIKTDLDTKEFLRMFSSMSNYLFKHEREVPRYTLVGRFFTDPPPPPPPAVTCENLLVSGIWHAIRVPDKGSASVTVAFPTALSWS